MRTDKQFYLPDTDAGRAEYLAKAQGYLDAMYKKLPEYFGRLPKAPLMVKRVEAFRKLPAALRTITGRRRMENSRASSTPTCPT